MKRLIFIFLLCFNFVSLSGRDSGYSIRNYGPKEYGGFNQLEKTFTEWKGQLEQIDDILIIGLRI